MCEYTLVTSPSDFIGFKTGKKFKFFCSVCGKLTYNNCYTPNRLSRYCRFLCKSCRSKEIRKMNPDSWKKAIETNKANHGGVIATQLPEYRKRSSEMAKAHPEWMQASLDSNRANHGGILFSQTDEGRDVSRKNIYNNLEKMSDRLKEIYGEKGPLGDKTIIEKSKQTKTEKYGDPNYVNPEKISETLLNKTPDEILEKTIRIKQTKLEKYGDPNYCNVNKIKQTKLERYGDPGYVNKEKTKQTRSKISDAQLVEARSKRKSKIQFDGLSFDSSWEFAVYCYCKDSGHDIDQAHVVFNYDDGVKHDNKYFPDFIINGEITEIKGSQFFANKEYSNDMINPYDNSQNRKYHSKMQCMLQNGVHILTESDVQPMIEYMKNMYTPNFAKLYNKRNIYNIIYGLNPYNIVNIFPIRLLNNPNYVEPVTKWRTPYNIDNDSAYV